MTAFRFAICRPGFERWLKTEWAREAPALRPSFQRPGLVTWKDEGGAPPRVPSVFARVQGTTLGFAKDADEALGLARACPGPPTKLHVFARGESEVGSRGTDAGVMREEVAQISDLRSRFTAEHLGTSADFVAHENDVVLDLAVAPGEPTLVGFHVHGPLDSPHAGGDPRVPLPSDAPSRAYLKLEEALAFAGADIGPNDVVVEIGSAPGGASLAMLRRGARVVGVDPGDMDPLLGTFGDRFRHIAKPVGAVTRDELPKRVSVIVCDVHLAAPVAVRALRRIVAFHRKSLRLLVLTLKLNDARVADDVPRLLEQVRALGGVFMKATQLPSNRQEITAVVLFESLAT